MNKVLSLMIGLFITSNYLLAQAPLQVIASSGQNLQSNLLNLDYTIGEAIIQEVNSDNLMLGQGFHQTFYSVATNTSFSFEKVSVSCFPNPTLDKVYVNYNNGIDPYFIEVTTIQGLTLNQEITIETISNISTKVDLTEVPSGTYIITLIHEQNNQVISRIKVIKL